MGIKIIQLMLNNKKMKKKKNVFARFVDIVTRWVVMRYLSGKISPHALLAAKNGLRLDHVSSQEPFSENFECNFPPVKIYSNSKGEKFVAVPLGFVSLTSYNSSVELMRLKKEFCFLLSQKNNLFSKFEDEKAKSERLIEVVKSLGSKLTKFKNGEFKSEPSCEQLKLRIARLEGDLERIKGEYAKERISRTKLESCNQTGVISKELLRRVLRLHSSSPEKQIEQIKKLIF